MRHFLLFALTTLLCVSCYDSAKEPSSEAESPAANTTLAALQALYAGTTFDISTHLIVSGVVTSNDRAGNFYRTLILEADGVGIELMAGIDGLHNIYPQGYKLTVNLKGLAVGQSHGILQIGRSPQPGSSYPTDYIGSRAALDRHLFRGDAKQQPQPLVTDIGSLTPAMAGRLVRIDGVHFAPEEVEPMEWAGYKRFTDADENIIYTYTRPYANFATHAIPAGELLLMGILQCDCTADGIRYTLKLRDEKDCWY
ncbi:MAG: DUF5689 domain-containing protein [Alistipes sp.]